MDYIADEDPTSAFSLIEVQNNSGVSDRWRWRRRRRVGVGAARGASGVLLQPRVDAGGVKHVRAARQRPHRLPVLQRAQAHHAVRRRHRAAPGGAFVDALAVGKGGERRDGGGVEPGLLTPAGSAGGGRAPPLEQGAGVVDDEVENEEDAEGDADDLDRGIQIGGIAWSSASPWRCCRRWPW